MSIKKTSILVSALYLGLFCANLANSRVMTINERKYPYFMMMPRNVWQDEPGKTPETSFASQYYENVLVNHESFPDKIGFRIFDLSPFEKEEQRVDAAKVLARSGAVQTGDVLLTFRPNWSKFMAYNRVQMGVSHTALAVIMTEKGSGDKFVHTLESPLNYSSALSSRHHYFDKSGQVDPESAVFFHVLRPKLSDAQKQNLEKWAKLIIPNIGNLYPDRLPFDKDYAAPEYTDTREDEYVEKIGRIILGESNVPAVSTYCSETVRAFLLLSNCNPDEVRISRNWSCLQTPNPVQQGAVDYKKPQFALGTDNQSGLMTVPSNVLKNLGLSDTERQTKLSQEIVKDGPGVRYNADGSPQKPENMSSGHFSVAVNFRDYLKLLNQYYQGGESNEQMRSQINGAISRNYSPTSYLGLTTMPRTTDPNTDQMRYVGTLSFKPVSQILE